MHQVALLLDPNNLQHSEILELIQNKVVVKDARRLLHVGFDAADIPGVGALQHLHQHLQVHPEGLGHRGLGLVGHPLDGSLAEAAITFDLTQLRNFGLQVSELADLLHKVGPGVEEGVEEDVLLRVLVLVDEAGDVVEDGAGVVADER